MILRILLICLWTGLSSGIQNKDLLEARNRAFDYLISQRNPGTFGWPNGRTPAVILGLLSARPTWFTNNNEQNKNTNLDAIVTVKQLEVEILGIINNDLKLVDIDSANLALYMGALQVACFDLRDFHGQNLLEIVQKRLPSTPATSPAFASLTLILCNDNIIAPVNAVRKLANSFKLGNRCTYCVETAAMNVQALVCIGRRLDEDSPILRRVVKRLKVQNRRFIDSVQDEETGGFGDVISTSLALQAQHLTWTGRKFDVEKAEKYLLSQRRHDGSFSGSTLVTTLAIPALSKNTAVTGGTTLNCPAHQIKRSKDTIKVTYTLSDQVFTKQSITASFDTKRNYSLYEAFKEFSRENPDIFKLNVVRSSVGIQIKSINKLVNDVSTRTFWKVSEIAKGKEMLIRKGLEKIQLKENVLYKFTYSLLQ